MYVSIRDCLLMHDFATPLDGLRALGLESVELELSSGFEVTAFDSREKIVLRSDEDAEDYRKRLKDMGVHPCSLLTTCDFSAGENDDHVRWMVRALEIAAILGMDNIRVDSAMSRERELDFEARVRIFSDGLKCVLKAASGLSVAMGIENHGFQGNNLAFLLNVFDRVGSTRLGSTLDTGNFYWRGYPLSEVYGILRVLAPYAKHTHLKNIRYPEHMRETMREAGWEYGTHVSPLELGDIDHCKVIGMLGAAGYEGDLCIEDESLGKFGAAGERIDVLKGDVRNVQRCLEAANRAML